MARSIGAKEARCQDFHSSYWEGGSFHWHIQGAQKQRSQWQQTLIGNLPWIGNQTKNNHQLCLVPQEIDSENHWNLLGCVQWGNEGRRTGLSRRKTSTVMHRSFESAMTLHNYPALRHGGPLYPHLLWVVIACKLSPVPVPEVMILGEMTCLQLRTTPKREPPLAAYTPISASVERSGCHATASTLRIIARNENQFGTGKEDYKHLPSTVCWQ